MNQELKAAEVRFEEFMAAMNYKNNAPGIHSFANRISWICISSWFVSWAIFTVVSSLWLTHSYFSLSFIPSGCLGFIFAWKFEENAFRFPKWLNFPYLRWKKCMDFVRFRQEFFKLAHDPKNQFAFLHYYELFFDEFENSTEKKGYRLKNIQKLKGHLNTGDYHLAFNRFFALLENLNNVKETNAASSSRFSDSYEAYKEEVRKNSGKIIEQHMKNLQKEAVKEVEKEIGFTFKN